MNSVFLSKFRVHQKIIYSMMERIESNVLHYTSACIVYTFIRVSMTMVCVSAPISGMTGSGCSISS